MRALSSSVTVNAPGSFTIAFLTTYFLERGSRAGNADLALRFPLPKFLIDGLTIEKVVKLQLGSHPPSAGTGRIAIDWQPVGEGPLPSFSGTISTQPLGEAACRLMIDGSYAPPGGIAGAIFDRLIGVRIARATLTALLAQFERAIDADYAARLIP